MNMLDFLLSQNSSEAPSFLSILLAVLSSLFLSSLIVLTYEFTSPQRARSANFLQSLALISIVAATVMQAIGDSLARGLGMLGALAIIRFRTRLNNPRNMTFMFASLAVGISCGVFGFTIAFVGTVVFCITAVVLRFTRFARADDLRADLRITSTEYEAGDPRLEGLLEQYCRRWSAEQFRVSTSEAAAQEGAPVRPVRKREFTYEVAFLDQAAADALLTALNGLAGIQDIRLRFQNTPDEL